jgi:uncharacterized membrane protein
MDLAPQSLICGGSYLPHVPFKPSTRQCHSNEAFHLFLPNQFSLCEIFQQPFQDRYELKVYLKQALSLETTFKVVVMVEHLLAPGSDHVPLYQIKHVLL